MMHLKHFLKRKFRADVTVYNEECIGISTPDLVPEMEHPSCRS